MPYTVISEGTLSGYVHHDWVARLGDPARLVAEISAGGGRILRGGGGQGVTSLREVAGATMFCKVYPPSRLSRRLRDILGVQRSEREWRANCIANSVGIPTATVVAALGDGPALSRTHYFLTLPAPGVDVIAYLREHAADPERRRAIVRALGRMAGAFHNVGFWHAHLNASHIFLTPELRITVIDLERSRVQHPLPAASRQRNILQLTKSLRKQVPADDLALIAEGHDEVYARRQAGTFVPCDVLSL